MASALPQGDPIPHGGPLVDRSLDALGQRPFGIYVHVPFCASRCGYCDFNTYTATELGDGVRQDTFADVLIKEIDLARRSLGTRPVAASTVFFGGGTPTLLSAIDLTRILHAIDDRFGLADGAEVTTEANPESVDPAYFEALLAGGFTRVSLGMQSSTPRVLAVLDRTHTPGRAVAAAAEARAAGFEQVSLDLIYGAPGESDDDWRRTLDTALAADPDHVSAYSLIVEDGTALAGRVKRGEIEPTDDDVLATRYELADAALDASGRRWYEVSNWSLAGAQCQHNLGYWRGDDWWGIGPGAHSHVQGTRWWNVKHPAAYAQTLSASGPAVAREVLSVDDRLVEEVLLRVRLAEGLPTRRLPARLDTHVLDSLVEENLIEASALAENRVVLTQRGRLLADHVVRRLLP